MNFRLRERGVFDHPKWLPTFIRPLILTALLLVLCTVTFGLPYLLVPGILFLVAGIILPVGEIPRLLLLATGFSILAWLDPATELVVDLALVAGLCLLCPLLRRHLLEIEWRLAALTLWQTIDESKSTTNDIIVAEVLREIKKISAADLVVSLRHLDEVTAEIAFIEPKEAFPSKFLSPAIYEKALTLNEIVFDNSYRQSPDAAKQLIQAGVESAVIVPLRSTDKAIGAVILGWKRKKAVGKPMQSFFELIFERLYASLLVLDAGHRLDKLQRRYDAILRTMPQGVVFIDDSGEQAWANSVAAKLLGIPEGTTGLPVMSQAMAGLRMNAENQEEIARTAMRLFSAPDSVINDWEWNYSKPQDLVLCVSSTPTGKDGAAGRLWMFEDITERRQAQMALQVTNRNLEMSLEELGKANAKLVELNAEKNEFMGIAAHDLKNPLSAIMGISNILYEEHDTLEKAELKEFSKLVVDSAQQMFDLIRKLLDANAIDTGAIKVKQEPVELGMLLSLALRLNQSQAENKDIRVHYSEPPFPLQVCSDEEAIIQIIDNLLSNAIKYSPRMSNVYVWIEDKEKALRLIIKDEGPGLSEDDKKKLFGKFARLSAQPTGGESSTGLGLSIVKKLSDMIGAEIWCESELGRGAAFILELPKE